MAEVQIKRSAAWIWFFTDVAIFLAIYILGCFYDGDAGLARAALPYFYGLVSVVSALVLVRVFKLKK
jgi:hypothetical protein